MRNSRDRTAGFTLVEVLVALSILAGVTATILVLVVSSRERDARATAQTRGLLAAEAMLERVGLDIPLEPQNNSGRLPDGARWTIVVAPYFEPGMSAAPDLPGLFSVTVRIAPPLGPPIVLRTLREAEP